MLGSKTEIRPDTSDRREAVTERLSLIQAELANAQTFLETLQPDRAVLTDQTDFPIANLVDDSKELVPKLQQIRNTVGDVYQDIEDAA